VEVRLLRVWLVRTGEKGFALTDCVRSGVVALRYTSVPDARSLSVDEIAEGVREAGTRSDFVGVARMLQEFVHDVDLGDLVVSTHAADRAVYFGQVTGDYRFADDTPVPGFRHLRDVDWWGALDRDVHIPVDRRKEIDRPPTFYELSDAAYWIGRAEASKSGAVRAPSRVPEPRADGNLPPKSPSAPTQVCRQCFQRKPAAIVIDGVCADCS